MTQLDRNLLLHMIKTETKPREIIIWQYAEFNSEIYTSLPLCEKQNIRIRLDELQLAN